MGLKLAANTLQLLGYTARLKMIRVKKDIGKECG